MQRGTANTRWRDLADIYLLTGTHTMQADVVREAIQVVARHRSTALRPLRMVQDGYADFGQAKWAAWRRKQQLDAALPELLEDVLTTLWEFAHPLADSGMTGRVWHSDIRQWATDSTA